MSRATHHRQARPSNGATGGARWDRDPRAGNGRPAGPIHHPSAELLSGYLTGNISPGVALAVAAHIDLCALCRAAAEDGFVRRPRSFRPARGAAVPALVPPGSGALGRLHSDCWMELRTGLEGAVAHGVSGLGECVYLLRATPGAEIGVASVASAFVLLVTAGGIETDGRRLRAGSFLQLETPPVSLRADPDEGAALLVVADDLPRRLRLQEG